MTRDVVFRCWSAWFRDRSHFFANIGDESVQVVQGEEPINVMRIVSPLHPADGLLAIGHELVGGLESGGDVRRVVGIHCLLGGKAGNGAIFEALHKALVETAANERWSMDFMSERLETGRYFQILTVID